MTYCFLFQCKNVMIEKFMKLFIGVVDAELLKRVVLKVFKAKYV